MESSISKTTRQCIKDMQNAMADCPWQTSEFYAMWLAQTYFYVRNATRVLAKAAYRCTHEEEFIHKKMLQGITEERNHEIMAINDLREVGYEMSEMKELPSTTSYYQTLLAAIDYDGPYALLGYFVALEGLGAIGADYIFESTFEKWGKKGTQFLRVHTRVDQHHFTDGLEFIESLPKDKQVMIEKYVVSSTHIYLGLLAGVKAHYKSLPAPKKAPLSSSAA